MAIPVLPYIPSMGIDHGLLRQFIQNKLADGYVIEKTTEFPTSRANGVAEISSYNGLNVFKIGYNRTLAGVDKLADQLWTFFITRLDNINEPFLYYNCPTERSEPDLTGQDPIGRYYVKLRNPNIILSRELFMFCVYRYGLELIETKEFNDTLPNGEDTVPGTSGGGYIEIPLEIIHHGFSPFDAGAVLFKRTMFPYNPADYDQVINIPIEFVATNQTSETIRVSVVEVVSGAVCGYIDIPPCETQNLRTGRNTTGQHFTPLPGDNIYGLFPNSTNIYLGVFTARLIHRQRKTLTKTVVQYPLAQLIDGSSSMGWNGVLPLVYALEDLGHTDWKQRSPSKYNLYTHDTSRFDADTITYKISMIGEIMWGGSVEGALFDTALTGDPNVDEPADMVSGTRMICTKYEGWTVSDNNAEIITQTIPTLTNGHVYEFRARDHPFMFDGKLFSACLYIKLVGVRRFEIYHRFAKAGGRGDNHGNSRIFVPKSRSNVIQEICGYSPADTGSIYVASDGKRSGGTVASTNIVGSAVVPASTTKVTRRSSPFSITLNDYLVPNDTYTYGTGLITINRLLVTPINLATET